MNPVTPAVNNGYSHTLDKGLRVLALLHDQQNGLTVTTLASELGLHRTVLYRLLGTLRAYRLVTQEQDGRFRLGLGLIELSGEVRASVRRVTYPHLVALADEVSATAFLALADGDEAVSAAVVPPRNSKLHVGYHTGIRHPLNVSAGGVAILAARTAQPNERAAVTDARHKGFAVTSGEFESHAWGLAAALPASLAGSIGVVALTELDEDTVADAVIRAVHASAAELTAESGT